jgi:alpha-tubulin suppressor-like RCC1 family protein
MVKMANFLGWYDRMRTSTLCHIYKGLETTPVKITHVVRFYFQSTGTRTLGSRTKRFPAVEICRKISCEEKDSVMNYIYSWGSNKNRQSSSANVLHVYSPALYPDFDNLAPSHVAAGDSHTLVLTDYGDVYSFGRGMSDASQSSNTLNVFYTPGLQGELGHPEKENFVNPRRVEGLSHEICVDISCGSLTSFAITASGKVYNWSVASRPELTVPQ